MSNSYSVDSVVSLLDFLGLQCPDAKRATVRQWIKYGAVQINQQIVTRANHPLSPGDVVTLRPTKESPPETSLAHGVSVVYEDQALIVINKPAGLLSMATESERTKTAYAVLTHYVRRRHRNNHDRIWIVHRLDRDTSGLMVFARTESVKNTLQRNWHDTRKGYLAVVEGVPPESAGVLESHLDESHPQKVFSCRPSDQTRLAITHYRVIKSSKKYSLLDLSLETGRRNQIRVQLADVNCPVVGDPKYGEPSDPVKRLALHAYRLQFLHPVSSQPLTFESPLPQELDALL